MSPRPKRGHCLRVVENLQLACGGCGSSGKIQVTPLRIAVKLRCSGRDDRSSLGSEPAHAPQAASRGKKLSGMRLTLAAVTPRKQRLKSGALQELVEEYLQRTSRYIPATLAFYDTEQALLAQMAKAAGRTAPFVVLCDSRGKSLTSEAFAETLRAARDGGTQELLLAIGPANGWSAEARGRANLLLSFGAMTLAHELALAVLAEQVYRAQTILAGHPYHGGH